MIFALGVHIYLCIGVIGFIQRGIKHFKGIPRGIIHLIGIQHGLTHFIENIKFHRNSM